MKSNTTTTSPNEMLQVTGTSLLHISLELFSAVCLSVSETATTATKTTVMKLATQLQTIATQLLKLKTTVTREQKTKTMTKTATIVINAYEKSPIKNPENHKYL
ncbi:MAG: hypothetical protein K0R82_2535 [Flavipsychrobacter sp.]|jgi:hypothetical protein|nr:hypothetical protein [Flavipsychrobacter sp.]